jgi:chromosome partitioning protein
MTHILALAMQKGGVGKTTTTLAVGVELAALGKRVLLIDMDPQSNLTQAIGYDPSAVAHAIYDVLIDPEAGIGVATLRTGYGVDLVSATLSLAGAELMLANRIGRELILRSALGAARDRYDYILIDTAPSLGLLTVNALAAADAVIVPLQTHALALKAMGQLEETIRLVRQLNPVLHLGGLVLTMHDRRTLLTQAVEDEARQRYGDLVYQTTIPLTVKLAEAPAAGQPISAYAPDSSAARAYRELAQEVVARHDRT